MQEKRSEVFFIATCNAMVASNGQLMLPPELQRRGRLDAIFFAGFPSDEEVEDILRIHIALPRENCSGRDPSNFDVEMLSHIKYVHDDKAYPLSGAEIESAFLDALYEAFSEGREVTTIDIEKYMKLVRPISFVMGSTMEVLYEFGNDRCLPVSSKQLVTPYMNSNTTTVKSTRKSEPGRVATEMNVSL